MWRDVWGSSMLCCVVKLKVEIWLASDHRLKKEYKAIYPEGCEELNCIKQKFAVIMLY